MRPDLRKRIEFVVTLFLLLSDVVAIVVAVVEDMVLLVTLISVRILSAIDDNESNPKVDDSSAPALPKLLLPCVLFHFNKLSTPPDKQHPLLARTMRYVLILPPFFHSFDAVLLLSAVCCEAAMYSQGSQLLSNVLIGDLYGTMRLYSFLPPLLDDEWRDDMLVILCVDTDKDGFTLLLALLLLLGGGRNTWSTEFVIFCHTSFALLAKLFCFCWELLLLKKLKLSNGLTAPLSFLLLSFAVVDADGAGAAKGSKLLNGLDISIDQYISISQLIGKLLDWR